MRALGMRELCDILSGADDILLLTHRDPDGDALGAVASMAMLLEKTGKNVRVMLEDAPVNRLAFILGGINYMTKADPDDTFLPKLIVSLDCASSNRLGELEDDFSSRVDLSIDHHASNTPFADATYTDAEACATCEIIYMIARELERRLTKDLIDAPMAYTIFAGMASDTGSFKYTNTTPRSFEICAELARTGANIAEVSRLLFDTVALDKLKAEAVAVEKLTVFAHGKAAMIAVDRETVAKSALTMDDFDDSVNVARKVDGVEIGAYIRQSNSGEYKVSLRSNGSADVAALCAAHSGGGHLRAAGCTLDVKSMDDAIAIIKKDIEKEIERIYG